MRADQTIDIDGHAVTIRELTVGDIRAWLRALETPEDLDDAFGAVGELLFPGESLSDLTRMTSLTREDIEALSPSEVRAVIARVIPVVREVNADFFAMRARLADLGRASLAAIQQPPAAP